MSLILFGQIISLFVGISYGVSNVFNGYHGKAVSALFINIMSVAWTTFITLTWLI